MNIVYFECFYNAGWEWRENEQSQRCTSVMILDPEKPGASINSITRIEQRKREFFRSYVQSDG